MAPLVEKLPVPVVGLGEGPHWDSGRQTLYYVDILSKTFHRYVPATKEHAQSKPLETTDSGHFIVPLVGHKDLFAAGIGHKVYIIRWDGQNTSVDLVQVIAELDMENPKNAINDGKVGPDGRLYTGTVGFDDQPGKDRFSSFIETASFYSVSDKGVVTKIDSGIKLSNGIGFDQKKNSLYHVDSNEASIRRFDYDFATGKSSNKKNIFDYKAKNQNGFPDGMTIDTNGNVFVASFNGSNVLKINPDTGAVIETIEIPSKEVTSVTFGGPNLDILFVTTGSMYDKDGGATYAVSGLGERGYENLAFNYKGLK